MITMRSGFVLALLAGALAACGGESAESARASGGAGLGGTGGSAGGAGALSGAGGSGAAGVEFIPWSEFTNAGDSDALGSELEVRSVSRAVSSGKEDLLLAVASPSGDNRVIAIDTAGRTYRDHWVHFACGDCKAAGEGNTSVIAAPSGVYGSTDGGYRYFVIAAYEFGVNEPPEILHVVEGQAWVFWRALWLNAPLTPNQALAQLPWTRGIGSVWRDTGLQITSTYARLLSKQPDLDSKPETANPCAVPHPSYEFGLTYHDAERVIVACGDAAVAAGGDFPAGAFARWELDGSAVWIGAHHLATAASFYSTEHRGAPVGAQAKLAAGERVFGHVTSANRGYRVTNRGIGVSALAP